MIKLYPTPEAERILRKQHKDEQDARTARGLRPLSLSSWLVERLLAKVAV